MWITNTQNQIYTYLKYKVENRYKSAYPGLFFTQDDSPNIPASFPCVYVHFLAATESNSYIENLSINAVISTVEIQVSVTNDMGLNVANLISDAVVDALKELRFEMIMLPEFQNFGAETKRKIFRARRTIGDGDYIF